VPDQGTVLLYALSTLAQTCAALAAFVGAVGLFRVERLMERRKDTAENLRSLAADAQILSRTIWMSLAMQTVVERVDEAVARRGGEPGVAAAGAVLQEWRGFDARVANSRWWLVVFEGWNLLVIGASLVGFNYVGLLVMSPGTFWALWAAAIGTVAVTGYCVYAWTKD
jgi:hypothetical protein